jgi:hypothetical protein
MTTISTDSTLTTAAAPAAAAETKAAATAPAAVKASPAKPATKPAKAAIKPVAAAVAAAVAAPAKKAAPAKRGSAVKAKAAATPAPAPVADKAAKPKKPKMVRDSFTIPKDEYAVIESLKQRSGKLSQTAKKSELLRAGLKLLSGLTDAALLQALQAVPSIKTGRPKADDKAAAEAAPAAKRTKAERK